MITDDRIKELIQLGNENRNLDYKGRFSWTAANKDEKIGIVKDILAFANTRDGGVILIGVNDKSGVPEGLGDDEVASFDQTRFNDFVQEYTEPRHASYVYRRTIDGFKIIVIEIPEFQDVPILSKEVVPSVSNPKVNLLRKAGFYKRTDKATSELIEDADELRELLNRGVLRRQDEILSAMKKILAPDMTNVRSTDQSQEYEVELKDAAEWAKVTPVWEGAEDGVWELDIQPSRFVQERMGTSADVQREIRTAAVSLRGWNFPHIDKDSANFNDGFQSVTDWKDAPYGRHLESLRAYRSGLFRWRSTLWEEKSSEFLQPKALSYLSTIFGVTEWMIFAKRYFEPAVPVDEKIQISIRLRGSMGRVLVALYPATSLNNSYTAKIDPIAIVKTVEMTALRADPLSIARKFILQIFELFNWNTASADIVEGWQKRFVNRQI